MEAVAEMPPEPAAEAPALPLADRHRCRGDSRCRSAARRRPPRRPRPRRGAEQRQGREAAPAEWKELKKKRLDELRIKAFRDYFNYGEEMRKIPPHRVLAINRGERARVLRVKIESDLAAMERRAGRNARAAGPSPRRLSPRLRPRCARRG